MKDKKAPGSRGPALLLRGRRMTQPVHVHVHQKRGLGCVGGCLGIVALFLVLAGILAAFAHR